MKVFVAYIVYVTLFMSHLPYNPDNDTESLLVNCIVDNNLTYIFTLLFIMRLFDYPNTLLPHTRNFLKETRHHILGRHIYLSNSLFIYFNYSSTTLHCHFTHTHIHLIHTLHINCCLIGKCLNNTQPEWLKGSGYLFCTLVIFLSVFWHDEDSFGFVVGLKKTGCLLQHLQMVLVTHTQKSW